MESIFLVIILGVISAIYSQFKKTNNKTAASPILSNRSRNSEIAKRKKEKPKMVAAVSSSVEAPSKENSGRTRGPRMTVVPENSLLQNNPATVEKGNPIYAVEAPDQKQIVDAIIWSEILGPPRSKNPHFTRKNN